MGCISPGLVYHLPRHGGDKQIPSMALAELDWDAWFEAGLDSPHLQQLTGPLHTMLVSGYSLPGAGSRLMGALGMPVQP